MPSFEEYGNEHRLFLQAMMARGIISNAEFKPLFELCLKKCNVALPEQGDQATRAYKQFLNCINRKIEEKCSLMILKVFDEEASKKVSYLMLANQVDRSGESSKLTIKAMVSFAAHEIEYLKVIVGNILENPMRELDSIGAVNLSKLVQTKRITFETLIRVMSRQKKYTKRQKGQKKQKRQ